MRKKVFFILVLAAVLAVILPLLRAVNPTLVIRAGLLIDGTGEPARTNVNIFIRHASIQKIIPFSEERVPLFARRMNARNMTVIPGPVSYTHLTLPTN